MIVLDTNVASEILQPEPNLAVLTWLDSWPTDELLITATTAAEMRYGAALLPPGRRQTALKHDVERFIESDFAGQVVPFEVGATAIYAEIRSARRRRGLPISIGDAQIAAVCRQYDATLATRNVKDFVHTGVSVVNPWELP
jgi:hypothetical protein